MFKPRQELCLLILFSLLSVMVIWFPFFLGFQERMLTVFKNYDGPNYLVVSKTWYDKEQIREKFSSPVPLEYYPAHWPGYPLTIKLFNFLFPGPWAMLISTLLFTLLTTIIFYLFTKRFKLSESPFWLSLVFLVLPARWVAVKAVGSPEPLFIFAILASFYFLKSEKWLLAGILGAIAQITKTPAILLFISYLIYLVFFQKKPLPKLFYLFLIPVLILPVFWFYKIRTGDFLAYFHSGDNFHLFFPPFQAFSSARTWLGDFWREDLVWQYLLGALTVVLLIKQKYYDLASFAGVFFTATLFVAHRDLARYSLPLVPFSLIAFDKFIQKKEFKIALLIILPAIYLYALNFIAGNTAPIADWAPYL